MAQEMDDLEFLLPSELLTDDDLLTDFAAGFGNSGCLSSDLSSPVESVTGPLEFGSDDDDVVAELTRKLTRSGLGNSSLSSDITAKGLKLSGSPQSTLYGFKPGSRGSPNSDSRACSPPEAKSAPSWDLLYAAAEEVARMRLAEDTAAFYSNELFTPARKPGPVSVPQPKPDMGTGFYPVRPQTQTNISYHQLQAAKLQMKQNQLMMMIMKNGAMDMDNQIRDARRGSGVDRAFGLSLAAWPTLQQSQQQTCSAMKAAFLRETGQKKDRVGTGVFMPRRYSPSPAEARKKPGFSLNPNIDSMNAQLQTRGIGNFNPDYDVILKQRNNLPAASFPARSMRSQPIVNQEFRLPQEWTY
ncbi:Ypt/Rab-GAP domain of gyp1p superfamily protein [Striga asiatica]|uniref:Ypt/Rab-GAP domain of gyp1p superfamily protein n=1 Tax=Striga asiatica TaxID=4170 RepID=A0A5A7RJ37_STRAF|nr:Ypt/Rab-GAP domain of gyp1p superfamily protein [Striga asiatica]